MFDNPTRKIAQIDCLSAEPIPRNDEKSTHEDDTESFLVFVWKLIMEMLCSSTGSKCLENLNQQREETYKSALANAMLILTVLGPSRCYFPQDNIINSLSQ